MYSKGDDAHFRDYNSSTWSHCEQPGRNPTTEAGAQDQMGPTTDVAE